MSTENQNTNPMKVSFPALGWSKIVFRALLKDIPGIELVMPPKVTLDIIRQGVKPAPEFVCFPMKVTMGEMMNLYDKYGVKVFLQAMDCGPCRLGFYGPVQERIMRDNGYDVKIIPFQQFDLLTFEFLKVYDELAPKQNKVEKGFTILNSIRRALIKAKYIEDINRYEGFIRCREIIKGQTTQTVEHLMDLLDKEDDMLNLHSFDKIIKQEFRKIEIKRNIEPLRVVIAGEIHVIMEPNVNMDIAKKLGEEGIEIHMGLSLYDWVMHKLHINFRRKEVERLSKDYCPMDIGGEAQWVLGEYIEAQHEGFDGFVHVYPFTCMPEVSARGIIEGQSPDPFYMPIQFYSFDEHTGYEGMRTRIEAFIDLMKTNRENNPKFQGKYKEPKEIAEIYDQPIKTGNIFDFMTDFARPVAKFFDELGTNMKGFLPKEKEQQKSLF